MQEDAEIMSCGNCGRQTFSLYRVPGSLVVECVECKSTSVIKPTKPRLEIAFGEGSMGQICVMPRDERRHRDDTED